MLSVIGKYFEFMWRVCSRPEKWRLYLRQIMVEINKLGHPIFRCLKDILGKALQVLECVRTS